MIRCSPIASGTALLRCPRRSLVLHESRIGFSVRAVSSSSKSDDASHFSNSKHKDGTSSLYQTDRLNAMVRHNFPDFIEWWNRDNFRKVGYGLVAASAVAAAGGAVAAVTSTTLSISSVAPAVILGSLTAGYWHVGLEDMRQTSHAIRRNYPVLGNVRYILETIRPELRQYIVESDQEGSPYDRLHRTQIYQRAKNVDDTMPFGTRRDVYGVHHEWACHSMWPLHVDHEDATATRYTIGCADFGTSKPYSASVLNISGMSSGAISDNAILALNSGARLGNFYQNTGEGGVSRFHIDGGGDIVWNIGTGYFGTGSGTGLNRIFEPALFQETLESAGDGRIKMVELKLSQGAKPGHGGLLPRAKISREIAQTRKLEYPPVGDCHSPARHSAFGTAHELVHFIAKVRELGNGIPVGIKLCVGEPGDVAALCKAMVEIGNGPDFITVDGAEGGTGAAPPELSNSVGLPLQEGIVVVRNLLVGAGLKDKIAINASGRISSAFSVVRTIALGADITSAARAFMMSLGCIQALKCNTNKCPTGIATLNRDLMFGLDPELKSIRVFNYHKKTMQAASDLVGILGKTSFQDINGNDIMRRVTDNEVRTLSEHFPEVPPGSLLDGTAPPRLQELWDNSGTSAPGGSTGKKQRHAATQRWIY